MPDILNTDFSGYDSSLPSYDFAGLPGDQTAYNFAQDTQEAMKFQEYYPTAPGAEPAPWWASLATYGATRAIDAAVGPRINGSGGQQSTYAGQDGKTYVNGKATGAAGSMGGIMPLVLLGGLAFLLLG